VRYTAAVLAVSFLAAGAFATVAGSVLPRHGSPTLRVVGLQPLGIAGRGFRPNEHVRVAASTSGASQIVAIVAKRAGTFRAIFHELAPSRCDLVRVVATRRSGQLVVLKRLPPPGCSTG
jgi:hypothetical protein